MTSLQTFETWETTRPATQRHTPLWDPQIWYLA